jgi:hypothetical protein
VSRTEFKGTDSNDEIALFVFAEAKLELTIVTLTTSSSVVTARRGKTRLSASPPSRKRRRPVSSVRRAFAWKLSMPISSGVYISQPGSVYKGGTWHAAHRALPLNIASPFLAWPSNGFLSALEAGIAN